RPRNHYTGRLDLVDASVSAVQLAGSDIEAHLAVDMLAQLLAKGVMPQIAEIEHALNACLNMPEQTPHARPKVCRSPCLCPPPWAGQTGCSGSSLWSPAGSCPPFRACRPSGPR